MNVNLTKFNIMIIIFNNKNNNLTNKDKFLSKKIFSYKVYNQIII
jgi:hypothetical protein